MQQHFLKLLDYDRWAFDQVADTIKQQHVDDEKILYWHTHIVQSYRHWLQRFEEGTSDVPFRETRSLEEIEKLYTAFEQEMHSFLSKHDEASLQANITYSNSKGQSFTQPLQDILIHLFNHATHHRAQIVSRMRELGYEPPVTDYIFYLRQQG